jgi:hypothetical protein
MQKLYVTFLIAMALAFYVALDTAVSLRSGKTPGAVLQVFSLPYAERPRSPRRYWSYIAGNAIGSASCAGVASGRLTSCSLT